MNPEPTKYVFDVRVTKETRYIVKATDPHTAEEIATKCATGKGHENAVLFMESVVKDVEAYQMTIKSF